MTAKAQKAKVEYYGTGRRKEAVARVRVVPGKGRILINERPLEEYFGRKTLEIYVKQPLEVTGTAAQYDVIAKVEGGGFSGQAGAIRLGIARALLGINEAFRPLLQQYGLLTRDPRVKERKKYGLKKARRAPQYSKR